MRLYLACALSLVVACNGEDNPGDGVDAGSAPTADAAADVGVAVDAGAGDAGATGADASASVDAGNQGADDAGVGPQPDAGGGPAQGIMCGELPECVGRCADNDQECMLACVRSVLPDQQDEAQALVTCAQQNQCSPRDFECMNQNCADELNACMGGQPPPQLSLIHI